MAMCTVNCPAVLVKPKRNLENCACQLDSVKMASSPRPADQTQVGAEIIRKHHSKRTRCSKLQCLSWPINFKFWKRNSDSEIQSSNGAVFNAPVSSSVQCRPHLGISLGMEGISFAVAKVWRRIKTDWIWIPVIRCHKFLCLWKKTRFFHDF